MNRVFERNATLIRFGLQLVRRTSCANFANLSWITMSTFSQDGTSTALICLFCGMICKISLSIISCCVHRNRSRSKRPRPSVNRCPIRMNSCNNCAVKANPKRRKMHSLNFGVNSRRCPKMLRIGLKKLQDRFGNNCTNFWDSRKSKCPL